MVQHLFHIRINSSEENMNNGLYALMTSGASILCLKEEEYVVPEEAINKLNERKISYELVVDTEDSKKNAPAA